MAKKITKREKFVALTAYITESGFATENITNQDFVEFLNHEVELLERKNTSGEKKMTAQQVVNSQIKSAIAEQLEPNRLYTVTEIIKEVPECAELTNQRVSALMRQMDEDGIVTKVVEKRKSFYQLAERG